MATSEPIHTALRAFFTFSSLIGEEFLGLDVCLPEAGLLCIPFSSRVIVVLLGLDVCLSEATRSSIECFVHLKLLPINRSPEGRRRDASGLRATPLLDFDTKLLHF